MKYKICLVAVILTVWSQASYSLNSGKFKIEKVEATDRFFTLYSASGPVNHDGCEDGEKIVFWRDDFPNGYQSILSLALAAHASNKEVSAWLAGCKNGPWGKTLPEPGSLVIY